LTKEGQARRLHLTTTAARRTVTSAGGGVFQVRFERGQRSGVPMLAPFDSGLLIELEIRVPDIPARTADQRV
jgi:hypothetical protein